MLVLCCSSDNTIFLLVRSFHLNFVDAASAAALAALAVATVVVFVVVIVFFWGKYRIRADSVCVRSNTNIDLYKLVSHCCYLSANT